MHHEGLATPFCPPLSSTNSYFTGILKEQNAPRASLPSPAFFKTLYHIQCHPSFLLNSTLLYRDKTYGALFQLVYELTGRNASSNFSLSWHFPGIQVEAHMLMTDKQANILLELRPFASC